MNLTDAPLKFPIPWANSAGAGFIRPIPTASQIGVNAGYASLTDGFVPLNSTPTGAGGIPPFIQDTNGILFQATAGLRWFQAGGPIVFDSVFAAAIGGYPKGAVLTSNANANKFWVNQVDGNAVDPDGAGTNWRDLFAPVFVNPTFTGNIALDGPVTAGNTVNLGANASATTQAPGDNTAAVATDAFVQASGAAVYGAGAAYARSLVDGFSPPLGDFTSINSGFGGGAASPSLAFTAPVAGKLFVSASRVNSAVDGTPHLCTLYVDGVSEISDSSTVSMSHSICVSVAAGNRTVQYQATGSVQFNAVISYLYVPTPPVY